jgi:hypothetical protein
LIHEILCPRRTRGTRFAAQNYSFRASTSIRSESRKLLGVEADDEWRKGERSLAVYKEGKRVPGRPTKFVHRLGGWRRAIDKDKEDLDVSAQLAYWCELLKSRQAAVRTLQAQGCKMNIDLFIDEGPVVYIRIPPASLRDLGDLEIELSFGVYDWNELARE